MTETSISLLSIVCGILGALTWLFLSKPKVFGLTSCVLIGVFSSVFVVKSFGRIGFDPFSIMSLGEINNWLLIINLSVSLTSGFIGVYIASKLYIMLKEKN